MALMIIYILPAVFVLTAPLRATGIFLSICCLPGLSLFAFDRTSELAFEDLILSFPVSLGISGILSLALLYAGIPIAAVPYIIYALSVCAVLPRVIMRYSGKTRLTIDLSHKEVVFLSAAALTTLVLAVPVVSERVAITTHGFFHSVIASQILNGIFPPENPGLGGSTLSYHWGHHMLTAVVASAGDLQPLRVVSVLNVTSLFFIFCISYHLAKSFGLSNGYRYFVALAVIGLMRSDAGVFFMKNAVTGNLGLGDILAAKPMDIYVRLSEGVPWYDTRLFFMSKFYNANSMPIGLCLIYSYFLICLLMSKNDIMETRKKIYMTCLSCVLTGLAILYPFFLIVVLVHAPLWAGIMSFTQRGNVKEKFKKALRVLLPCIVAAVVVAPYLIHVSSGSTLSVGKTPGNASFIHFDKQIIRNLIVFWLPAPLIMIGLWAALKRLSFSREFLFLLSGLLICLLLSILLRMPWYDSYKFSYLLSLFFAVFFVITISFYMRFITNRWSRRIIISIIVLSLAVVPVITEFSYIYSSWFSDNRYAFSGRHLVFDRDSARNEAYSWIRNHTPPDALLVLPYESAPHPYWDIVAHNVTYWPAALSERSFFVINDVFAWGVPDYKERVQIRKQLLKNPLDHRVKDYMASLNRPVYLLLEKDFAQDYVLDQRVEDFELETERGFELVYRNNRQAVFRILD